MRASSSALGWGVALVVLGAVLLLRNAGAIASGVAAWPWAVLAGGLTLLAHPEARRGREIALPVGLVLVGTVFSLREVGALTGVPVAPILLILIGVVVMAGGLPRGSEEVSDGLALPLEGAASMRMELQYGAGTLRVSGDAPEGLAYEGSFVGGARAEVARTGDRLDVTVRHPRDAEGYFRTRRALDWNVALTDAIPVDLEVRSGASRAYLDLAAVALASLSLKTGASDTDIVLPGRGRYSVDIDAGAAEVTVRVPQGVAASIRTRSALASVDVDQARFPRWSGGYRSPDYDVAEHRADIDIEGGVASFTVR